MVPRGEVEAFENRAATGRVGADAFRGRAQGRRSFRIRGITGRTRGAKTRGEWYRQAAWHSEANISEILLHFHSYDDRIRIFDQRPANRSKPLPGRCGPAPLPPRIPPLGLLGPPADWKRQGDDSGRPKASNPTSLHGFEPVAASHTPQTIQRSHTKPPEEHETPPSDARVGLPCNVLAARLLALPSRVLGRRRRRALGPPGKPGLHRQGGGGQAKTQRAATPGIPRSGPSGIDQVGNRPGPASRMSAICNPPRPLR